LVLCEPVLLSGVGIVFLGGGGVGVGNPGTAGEDFGLGGVRGFVVGVSLGVATDDDWDVGLG
jgi:hypothetical protein